MIFLWKVYLQMIIEVKEELKKTWFNGEIFGIIL